MAKGRRIAAAPFRIEKHRVEPGGLHVRHFEALDVERFQVQRQLLHRRPPPYRVPAPSPPRIGGSGRNSLQ